jgi:nucleoside 2-deoxyribosyltransferase
MAFKYYLAGPMSGLPGYNFKAFETHAAFYRGRNMEIVSPHEVDKGSTDKPYHWYLREDLKIMLECDAVIMLTGWEDSRGACMEEGVAHNLDMFIFHVGPQYRLIHSRRGNQDATQIH